uniref:Multivesicular body subunit 12A n=1 Tax=Glossina morsitans morsitans TaxID=37546 RepID=A0A1B0G200_GLOMM
MNKAGKHIQSGLQHSSAILPKLPVLQATTSTNIASGSATTVGAVSSTAQKNVINSIMSFLPDNRPITSLQIVEDYEKCPKNFTSIHRTYDQDADADLWRENNILFGRQTTRYLCLSKTEGLPDYVLETLIVIAEKTTPPKGFSLLSRTADSEQKAWRKRQLSYKLSKRGIATQAITDIILCSKLKIAPQGFKMAGDLNGILICYKTATQPTRLPPAVPSLSPTATNNSKPSSSSSSATSNSEVEKALNRLNLNGGGGGGGGGGINGRYPKQPLPPVPAAEDHDYEEIQSSYQIKSPQRPAPKPPVINNVCCIATNTSGHSVGTLGTYNELEGVPFVINALLKPPHENQILPLPKLSDFALKKDLEYDFYLERQTLCIMKSAASKNPFFK